VFVSPLAFLWLALVVPLLVVLYLIRQETRVYRVPSVIHMLPLPDAQLPMTRRLARFVRDPLFYVQLLLLLILILSLAQPIRERSVRHTVFIIDVTASMQALEGSTSRLQRAIARAMEVLDGYGEEDRIAVLVASRHVRRVAPLTSSKEELVRVLKAIQPTDSSGTCTEAVFAAANLLMGAGGGNVVLFTDSPFALPESLEKEGLDIQIVGVGTKRQNAGIVSLDAPTSLMSRGSHLVAQLRNFGRDTMDAEISVSLDGEEADRQRLRIPAMASETVDFGLGSQAGIAHVRLHHEDALEVDNHAYAHSAPDQKLSIHVVSSRPALADFLRKTDAFSVTHTTPGELQEGPPQADVLLFDGRAPEGLPGTNAAFIDPQRSSDAFQVVGQTTGEVYYWAEGHPIIDQVALDNLATGTYPKIELGDEMGVVIGAQWSPIVAAMEKEDLRHVVCAFALHENLNDPAAVLLLFRILEWLDPRSQDRGGLFPAGTPLATQVPDTVHEVIVKTPWGEEIIARPSGGRLIFGQTDRVGPYHLTGPDFERIFIASLDSPEESDLTQPVSDMHVQPERQSAAKGKVKSSYSPWILIALPFFMLAEWAAFLRRKSSSAANGAI